MDSYQQKMFIEEKDSYIIPQPSKNLSKVNYLVLGLIGETGEFAEKLKKILRDKDSIITPEDESLLRKELGDIYWYWSAINFELGFSGEETIKQNLDKLMDRIKRSKIQGSGDER